MKTTEQNRDDIDMFLRKLHLFTMAPQKRREIVKNLADIGLTSHQVEKVWTEAQASVIGIKNAETFEKARGLFVSTITNPSLVYDIATEVEDLIAKEYQW